MKSELEVLKRAFRHFFRHTYDFDLEEEKFVIVASRTLELKKDFKTDFKKFIQFIDSLLGKRDRGQA